MKKMFFLIYLLPFISFSQQQQISAELFLNNANQTLEKTQQFTADFKINLDQIQTEGRILTKGKKTYIKTDFLEALYDGEKLYSINREDKEINVEDASKNEAIKYYSIKKLIADLKSNYNSKLDIKQVIRGGKTVQYIRLDPKQKIENIKYLLVGVFTDSYILYKVIQVGQDDRTISSIELLNFDTETEIPDELFVSDASQWKKNGFRVN